MAPLSDTESESSSSSSSSSSDDDELLFRPAFPARPPAAATATTKCTGANVNDDCNGKQSQAGAAAAAGAAGRTGRRRLVIDDDSSSGGSSGDDISSSSSSGDNSHDESSYCNDRHEAADDDDASQTSRAHSLQLGTPHILRKVAAAAASDFPATKKNHADGEISDMGNNGDQRQQADDGLIAALEDLALSPVGVVSTPMPMVIGVVGNGGGAAPSASTDAAAGNADPNARTTPARRLDGMTSGDDDDEEEETESDAEDGTSIFQTSRCDDDEDEEETEEEDTDSDDDDDIFQTSYYVRPDHRAEVGDGTDEEGIMTMTRPREPARLCLMDTDDEEGEEGKSHDAKSSRCSSSSSSSGFTISDDEGGCDEIGSLFREGLKISSPTSRLGGTDDDDDNHNSRSSATSPSDEPPALVLSPLEPSPDRVDMTGDDDEVVHVSSRNADEPTDSAWKHDGATDEYHLSGSGGSEECVQWPSLRVPAALYRRLFPHQRVGVQWMGSLHAGGVGGGILGDDMGLGKTFQTLTYLGGLMRAKTIRNALIICPVSVIRTWEREGADILRQSCVPKVAICVVSSDVKKHQRTRLLQNALHCPKKRPHLVITSYGLVSNSPLDFVSQEQGSARGGAWDYVVVDEGHKLKNQNTQVSKACRRICKRQTGDDSTTTRRLLLTGTPIQNNLKELWALFDFATSGRLLGPLRRFQNSYGDPIEAGRMKNATEWTIRTAEKANRELQVKLRPHFLQRLKSSEFKDKLPTKRELVVFTHLSEKQRMMYDQFLAGGMVASILTGETASPLEAITWLKKLCGHPYLVDKTGHSSICELGRQRLVEDSAKLHVLHDLLLRLNKSGHRTLVFSQSTKMLDIIQRVMSQKLTLSRIDGQTKEKDRQRFVDTFNSDGSATDCMLLSTKAAGIGLTLTGADRAIIFDPSWNPADDSQAVDRCFRIGQTKNVTVYRFITAGAIEEAMYRKIAHKDGIKRTVTGTSGSATERHFARDDLRKIFTLAPAGECEMLTMINAKSGNKNNAVGASGKPSFLEDHSGVVGLSSHDMLYTNSIIEVDDEPETPFAGTPLRKQGKTMGRAQRALAADSNTRTKLDFEEVIGEESSATDAPIDLRSERKPLATVSNKEQGGGNATENIASEKSQDPDVILGGIDDLINSGRAEDAMSNLLDVLESGSVAGPEKLIMHQKIAATATRLGWL